MPQATSDDLEVGLPRFSLVGEDPWQRLQRALRLIPAGGQGIGRRIAALVGITWGVMMALAVLEGVALVTGSGEPLMHHFGVHARCLWGIPLLVLAESLVEQRIPLVIAQFVRSGLVRNDTLPAFRAELAAAERLGNSRLAFAVIVALAATAAMLGAGEGVRADELSWATAGSGDGGRATLALTWYLLVVRPLFALLLLRWLWRLLVLSLLLRRMARLDLDLVPTHPDRAAGLVFLEEAPIAFVPVVLAISGVIAARLGHDVVYHDLHLAALQVPVAAFAALTLAAFLAPLLVFAPRLVALRRSASFAYTALVARHGRLVRRRWIDREEVPHDDLLGAPEIGPVADTIPLYETVAKIRAVPFGRRPIVALGLAVVLPFLPVVALEIPLREVLVKLAGALL